MNPSTSDDSQIQNKSTFNDSTEYISAASHYALKVAFQAVKQRCDKLQEKLIKLEEKNAKLQLNGSNNLNTNEVNNKTENHTEKRINDLLSHHIFMITAENKNLWEDLSKLKLEKQQLVNQNEELEAKLRELEISKKESPLTNLNNTEVEDGRGDLSSLQVFDSDNLKKCDREENIQDPFSSFETIQDSSIIQNSDQREVIIGMNNDLKEILDKKLNEDKKLLQQQKESLKMALDSMQKIFQGMKTFQKYLKTEEETTKSETKSLESKFVQTESLLIPSCNDLKISSSTKEMVCPFCCKLFVNILIEEIDKHILTHIQQCNEREMTSLKSFEVVIT